MLLIYKENIALRVQCGERAVWIQPVAGEYDNTRLLNTMARNEELLAQVHLSSHDVTDTAAEVAAYFREKGWLVRDPAKREVAGKS